MQNIGEISAKFNAVAICNIAKSAQKWIIYYIIITF
jgi:hypothetical protein